VTNAIAIYALLKAVDFHLLREGLVNVTSATLVI